VLPHVNARLTCARLVIGLADSSPPPPPPSPSPVIAGKTNAPNKKVSPFRCPLALASRPLVCPDYNILSAVLPHSPQKDPAAGPGILKNTNKSPIKKACAVKQTGPAQKKRVVRRAAPGGEVCAPLLFHLLLALAAD